MLEFAPIMPAFCSLFLLFYYYKNFAYKIDASLLSAYLKFLPFSLYT